MAEPAIPSLEPLALESTDDIYTVTETIYSGSSTCITRASHGDKSYIVKSNLKLLQHQKKLKKYYKEFSIGSSVNSPYVVKYVDFKRLGYGFAMIMNDIGGVPLKSVIPPKGFDIDEFLDVAIRIVQGLGAIHAAGVTHKDINPANIVINPLTSELNIIDFGMASQLHRNEVSPTNTGVMQGTIIYMSPEQTGRMNRVVDYRTDYYSLGITFYEMLAGEPPFSQSVDPLDLIYKHIAVYPRPLVEIRPEIEKPLSDVIAKMMSKNAEDRYQDCYGLLLDLRDLQRARRATGTTQCLMNSSDSLYCSDMEKDPPDHDANGEDEGKGEGKKRKRQEKERRGFVPGSRDLVRVLRVSQKLYGREEHVKKLTEIFARSCQGVPESSLVLVHGYSGVGKTLLVHEVHKPLAKSKGNYISGKFDLYMSASPYSGLVQAIKQLIQQILTESEEKLQQWKRRIMEGVGVNGQIIIDMIPEVELIIGPQPPVPELGTAETMHRYKEVLPSFVFSLACTEHPLVIFLDDLQWADSMTLSLLVTLLNPESRKPSKNSENNVTNENDNSYLLIVGAYRDNEVDYSHPLSVSIREIHKKGGNIEDIQLLPLSEPEVVQLLDDTFNTQRCTHSVETTVLGHLVHTKTQGNPFFVNQLLVTLHKHGHIRPTDPYGSEFTLEEIEEAEAKEAREGGPRRGERGGWTCDMEAIQAANYTSNVVDLMVGALKTLPPDVQKMIGMAATIGNQFELTLLASVCGLSERTTAFALRGAVKGEFLIPSADEVLEGPLTEEGMDVRGIVLVNAPQSPSVRNVRVPRRLSSSNLSNSGSASYRFAHDRVQQASLSLLSKEDLKFTHLKLSEQLLLKVEQNEKAFNQHVHQIVNHLNTGLAEDRPPLLVVAQRDDHSFPANSTSYLPFSVYSVASLNMLAASKAKSTNAYVEAMQFTDFGIQLLEMSDPERVWREQHTLIMGLHKLRSELRTLSGDFTDPPCTYLLPRARSLLEKAEVYILVHDRHEAESNMPGALNVVFECLELLGISLPRDTDEQKKAFLQELSAMQKKLSAFSSAYDLINLPDCTDPIQLSIFKLLSSVWIAAYMMGHVYLAGLVCTLTVIRSVDYGMCAHTGKALVVNTLHSLAIFQDYFYLNNLAKAGLHILDTRYPQYKSLRGAAYLLYGVGVSTWVYPLSECLQYLEASFQLNKQVSHEFEKTLPFWKEEGSKYAMHTFMELMAQPIWELSGIPKIGGDNVEESIIEKIPLYKAGYNYVRMFCSYFMGERAHLLQYADVASEIVPICFMGVYRVAETEIWASLVYLDWISRSSLAIELYGNPKRKRKARHAVQGNDADIDSEAGQDRNTQIENMNKRLQKIGENIRHMAEVSHFCEANFHHKTLLMRAELARVALMFGSTTIYSPTNLSPSDSVLVDKSDESEEEEKSNKQDFESAVKLYEAAIESARRFGFQQFEALGLELYGQFWLTAPTKPNDKFALMYYSEAIVACEKWGAMAKASLLRDKCSKLFPNESTRSITSIRSKKSAISSNLDMDVIVQAAQTISNEVDFDTLVVKMVKAIVENANAQRGTFFLCEKEDPPTNTNLWVSAEYIYQNRAKSPETTEDPELNGRTSPYTRGISLLQPRIPLAQWKNGPKSIVHYVCRMLQPVVLNCAHDNNQFWTDEYIAANRVKSVICMPILLKKSLKGVMYLENNLCEGLYCKSHVDLLKVLTSQMAISLENIDFLHFQIEKQSEKLRFEQLQRDEKAQRDRADAAEKYKFQLENFIDMICHEIRNPLNGIFGNTDLIFYYLEAIEEILQKQKLTERTGAPPPSIMSQSPKNSPSRVRQSNMKTNSPKDITTSVEEAKQALASQASTSVEKEQAKNPEKLIFYLLEQLVLSTNSIQKCAEHQKCMTDDVLQLSRLRSHKLAITNTYYHPWDTLMTAMTIFKPQAESKGLYLRLHPEGGNYENTELLGDAVRIYQILSNLISNALKFTHRGGVTITFSITDLPDTTYDSPIPKTPTYSPSPIITPIAAPSPSAFSSGPSSASSTSSYHHSSHFPFPSPRVTAHSTPSSPTSPNLIFPVIPGTKQGTESPSTPHAASPRNGNIDAPFRDSVPCILTILVHDTGIGMSQDEQARIFKRFSQANNRTSHEYGGSGLGLAICRKLAKLMLGSISLVSEKGKGSTFSLMVPCRKACHSPSLHRVISASRVASTVITTPSSSASSFSSPTPLPTHSHSSALSSSLASCLLPSPPTAPHSFIPSLPPSSSLPHSTSASSLTVSSLSPATSAAPLSSSASFSTAKRLSISLPSSNEPDVSNLTSDSTSDSTVNANDANGNANANATNGNGNANGNANANGNGNGNGNGNENFNGNGNGNGNVNVKGANSIAFSSSPEDDNSRILIVEDNILNQSVLTRVLKIKGFLVDVANNGAEGVNKFKEQGLAGNWYDFVLMDLQMPVMDGITATGLIRKFEDEVGRSPTAIIGLSGNARDEYRQTALAAGMSEYITKPYHKEVLYGLLGKK